MTVGIEAAEESRSWRLSADGVMLLGGQCRQCGLKLFPWKDVCPACGAEDVAHAELARRGRLYSYTTIHASPKGFSPQYNVGFVDLEDGVRIFAQIEGEPKSLTLDQWMEPVLGVIKRVGGEDVEGLKFRKAQ